MKFRLEEKRNLLKIKLSYWEDIQELNLGKNEIGLVKKIEILSEIPEFFLGSALDGTCRFVYYFKKKKDFSLFKENGKVPIFSLDFKPFTMLEEIYIKNWPIENLPCSMFDLPRLRKLVISRSLLRFFPEEIRKIKTLRYFHIGATNSREKSDLGVLSDYLLYYERTNNFTCFDFVPSSIKDSDIEILRVDSILRKLPYGFSSMKNLKLLDLRNSDIRSVNINWIEFAKEKLPVLLGDYRRDCVPEINKNRFMVVADDSLIKKFNHLSDAIKFMEEIQDITPCYIVDKMKQFCSSYPDEENNFPFSEKGRYNLDEEELKAFVNFFSDK